MVSLKNILALDHAKNVNYLSLEKFVKLISSAFFQYSLLSTTQVVDFGIYSFVLSITGVLVMVSNFGLETIIFRDLIKNKGHDNGRVVAWSLFRLVLMFSLGMCLFFYFYQNSADFFILVVILIFSSFFDVITAPRELAMAGGRHHLFLYCSLIMAPIQIMGAMYLLFNDGNVTSFAWLLAISKFCFILPMWLFQRNYINFDVNRVKRELKFIPFKDAIPLLFSNILLALYGVIDIWMIKYYLSDFEVGIYGFALRYVSYFAMLNSIVPNVLFPDTIQACEKLNNENNDILLVAIYRKVTILSVFIWLGCVVASLLLIIVFPDYQNSLYVIFIYSFALIFGMASAVHTKVLLTIGYTNVILTRAIMALFINFISIILLLPLLGLSGAALSTILAECFIVLLLFNNPKTRRFMSCWLSGVRSAIRN